MRTLAAIAAALAIFAVGIMTNSVSASAREDHRCNLNECIGGGDHDRGGGDDRGDRRDFDRFHHRGFNNFGGFNDFGFFPNVGVIPDYVEPYPYYPYYLSNPHIAWCLAHYRTYNPATNTFFIRRGVPAVCVSPYSY